MPLIKNASDDLRPIFSGLSLSHGATITRTFAYLTWSLFSFRNVHVYVHLRTHVKSFQVMVSRSRFHQFLFHFYVLPAEITDVLHDSVIN